MFFGSRWLCPCRTRWDADRPKRDKSLSLSRVSRKKKKSRGLKWTDDRDADCHLLSKEEEGLLGSETEGGWRPRKSLYRPSLSLRWCVVAAAAAARRGNQVFVHLARVFLGAIYSCRRKAAATPQLPLILVWVVYLYVCVCAGRPADLICFFPLLGTFEIHPTASSCIYIHPSGGSSASLLLSKGFSLPSRQYRSQYTPARRSHWGWVFYRGFFFWRRGGAFVVGDIVLTQRYELERARLWRMAAFIERRSSSAGYVVFPYF